MAHPRVEMFEIFVHDPALTSVASLYIFDRAGDELPLHSHPDHGHCSFVSAGAFELFDDAGASRVLSLHESVPQYTPNRPHGFRALADGAVLLNIALPRGAQ